MLQFYDRPWMISTYVASLKACSNIGTLEMVVNVDNPEQHKEW